MTVVVDASVVVAALVDVGETGRWAEEILVSSQLAAPHLMPAEVANVLRRASFAGDISADVASLAHADLQAITVDLFPYRLIAERAWDMRQNITIYDAFYVALAELLDADLATLDERLARAPGTTCRFLLQSR